MPKALITLTDEPDGSVSIKIELSPAGMDKHSAAHCLADEILTHIQEIAATGEG